MQLHRECVVTPTLRFPAPPAESAGGVVLQVCDVGDPRRAQVEDFIRAVFVRTYGARVHRMMPRLLAFRDRGGELLGALGVRSAAARPLFLEAYLDSPVEACIAARVPGAVTRAGVVEIGNLALAEPGHARTVIKAVTAFLRNADLDWVVFTAVSTLRNAFYRLGLDPVPLAPADPARLGAAAADWGRYYETRPVVYAGSVQQGVAGLTSQPHRPCLGARRRPVRDPARAAHHGQ